MDLADNNFIDPRQPAWLPDNRVAVIYPAQFFPVVRFDDVR